MAPSLGRRLAPVGTGALDGTRATRADARRRVDGLDMLHLPGLAVLAADETVLVRPAGAAWAGPSLTNIVDLLSLFRFSVFSLKSLVNMLFLSVLFWRKYLPSSTEKQYSLTALSLSAGGRGFRPRDG